MKWVIKTSNRATRDVIMVKIEMIKVAIKIGKNRIILGSGQKKILAKIPDMKLDRTVVVNSF